MSFNDRLLTDAKAASWRQRGFSDGLAGHPAKLPDDVPEGMEASWWTGFRRGRERRLEAAAIIEGGSGGA